LLKITFVCTLQDFKLHYNVSVHESGSADQFELIVVSANVLCEL
jgi:uncharacterized protein YlxP (DUF503 family)